MMTPRTNIPPAPETTGGWSLFDLRRHLVSEAATLTERARRCRGCGDTATAIRLGEESRRLRAVASTMSDNELYATDSSRRR